MPDSPLVDTQVALYVPSDLAPIIKDMIAEVEQRNRTPGPVKHPRVTRNFYVVNVLVGARAICECLNTRDNPNQG